MNFALLGSLFSLNIDIYNDSAAHTTAALNVMSTNSLIVHIQPIALTALESNH